MSLPKVSIVIPSYKPAHFEQCLKSAIGQTYPNLEILVSDNCPTEEIRDICARYPGVIYQRNVAIREDNLLSCFYSGKGALIKPLFDDDILHPFCVERMVAVMNMDPKNYLVFSASQVINSDNERTESRRPYEASGSMPGQDMHRSMALGMRNFIGELTTIMVRREQLWKIAPLDLFRIGSHDFTKGLADVAAYCNLVKGGNAFYIDEELSYFRRDQRLQSNSNPNSNPNFGNCFSDSIDLLWVSHEIGLISAEELKAQQMQVEAVTIQLGSVFEQMGRSRQRYTDYVTALPAQ
ncbi:MAG: glycosyltransferase family 2 protein [Sphingomonadaceae bacterium]